MKVKARIYGSSEHQGKVKEFKVIDYLPEIGEQVSIGDPYYTYKKIKFADLDPEQRHSDEDKLYDYVFYIVYTGFEDEPEDEWMENYVCIERI